ncbi:polysaccharide deacetylase family protein [Paenibacillus larvae]|uniref:polysaccharide deacetylase family protein n=1 Tax=Paenibacillus larvae TaxID=1464 RepID=UPI00227EC53B|nr:polysaccharide deacetylase family protein [Paenibacillus larvae]MCY7477040.1 polysaccharide deacetylase family protein [Paenibacillus larvae]
MRRTFVITILALVLFSTASFPAHAGFSDKDKEVNMLYGPVKGRDYFEPRGDIVWEVPMGKKMMALTFDDGPDPDETMQILDLLKQYEAKATFFLIGNRVIRYPDLVKREASEGHELANHTYSHAYFNRASKERMIKEIKDAEEAIFQASGVHTCLFRPPGGYYNQILVDVCKANNYTPILWSWHQDTVDWKTPGVKKIVNKVLNNARGGDIVLFHDHVEGSTQTIEALKQILPELKKRGFRFVTVSELMRQRNLNQAKPLNNP